MLLPNDAKRGGSTKESTQTLVEIQSNASGFSKLRLHLLYLPKFLPANTNLTQPILSIPVNAYLSEVKEKP